MEKYFKDLNVKLWSGFAVILDVDGTLTADGGTDPGSAVLAKILELKENNSVFLSTNKKDFNRNAEISRRLNTQFLSTIFHKPDARVAQSLPPALRPTIVVVGDKFVTDGLLARNLKAKFVKVKRIVSPRDSLTNKLIYFVDDILYALIGKKLLQKFELK